MEATGYQHAEDTSVVYVDGGYDLWRWKNCQGHLISTNLSLEMAAQALADAYMEAKARFVITDTWGEDPQVAERILASAWDREKFFRRMDDGSEVAAKRIVNRRRN